MEKWHTPEERRAFIEARGVSYLPKAELSEDPSFQRDLKSSPYYLENEEEFQLLQKDYGPLLENAYMADVSIRFISSQVGYGLFAESDLEGGALIGEYSGVIQPGEDITAEITPGSGYETDYTWDYPDSWYEDLLLEINALKKGNELRFVNHSFEPNLVVEHTLLRNRWVIFFIARGFIKSGTQLTVDYGEEYWSGGFRELILF